MLFGHCVLQRKARLAPSIQSALQRPDVLHALFSEEQRHTGAGSFVWSSAVEDHFAVRRQPIALFLQFLHVHAKRAGNRFGVRLKIKRVS